MLQSNFVSVETPNSSGDGFWMTKHYTDGTKFYANENAEINKLFDYYRFPYYKKFYPEDPYYQKFYPEDPFINPIRKEFYPGVPEFIYPMYPLPWWDILPKEDAITTDKIIVDKDLYEEKEKDMETVEEYLNKTNPKKYVLQSNANNKFYSGYVDTDSEDHVVDWTQYIGDAYIFDTEEEAIKSLVTNLRGKEFITSFVFCVIREVDRSGKLTSQTTQKFVVHKFLELYETEIRDYLTKK